MAQTTRIPGPGEPAPWFHARCTTNPNFAFDSVAGRYVVLCFFGTASHPLARRVLDDFLRLRTAFDDDRCCFFGVSVDPEDERQARVRESLPGLRYFWDTDRSVSRLYGAEPGAGTDQYRPVTFLLDTRLRVVEVYPLAVEPESHAQRVIDKLNTMPPIPPLAPALVQAPILVVPGVFEPDFCRKLIDYYGQQGGKESGFMREKDGKTVGILDPNFKKRRDCDITDERLRAACMHRIHDRLVPEIRKAYQFNATRMERYIVCCYDADTGGYFHAHRDNTTKGTAHRKFACSINLNAEEFSGGDLRFPEFGRQTYRPPTGGAVVFSCSLLHEATAVTRGKRYAFLPFLYDDEAAKLRAENLKFLEAAGKPG